MRAAIFASVALRFPEPVPMPSRLQRAVRASAALVAFGALGTLGACADDPELNLVEPQANAAFMQRYVALGSSIDAGVQNGGISEATQRQAWPALVARAAGTTYEAAYLAGPGCAPQPTFSSAFLAAVGQVLPAGPCMRVAGNAGAVLLNNVAVPGTNSADATNAPGGTPNVLSTLILGGRTQVQRALELDPTFVSVWVGNNDVLGAGLRGDTVATSVAAFTANYQAMVLALTAGTAGAARKGILIGLVDITATPALIPAALLVNNTGGYRTAIEQGLLRGRTLAIVPGSCPANTTALVSLALLLQLAQAAQAPNAPAAFPFACQPTTIPGPGGTTITVGTSGVLDATERSWLAARVAALNTVIEQLATQKEWAYWSPNPLLQTLRSEGRILTAPDFADPVAPFGTAFSLDGFHPSAEGQRRIAAGVITAINAKYGSTIPTTFGTVAAVR